MGEATKPRDTNGVKNKSTASPSKSSTRDAFDLYCEKERPILEDKAKDSDVNVDEELERGWKELPESDKETYRAKVQDETKEAPSSPKKDSGSGSKLEDDKPEARDEDVEMRNYDTEDAEPPAGREEKDGED